jgi:hypothetical protein
MSAVMTASIRELCAPDHHDDPAVIARWTGNKTVAGVAAMLENPDVRLFVAEVDGTVAAVGAISPGKHEILLNYADPAHRFAGVSKALLTAMEEALGPGEARLDSTITAHRFYSAAGWTDAGVSAEHFGLTSIPMRKWLS